MPGITQPKRVRKGGGGEVLSERVMHINMSK